MRFFRPGGGRLSGPTIRPLTQEDAGGLERLLDQQPVSHLFAIEQYRRLGLPPTSRLVVPRPASPFMGVFEPDRQGRGQELVGAFWSGANLVPVAWGPGHTRSVAEHLRTSRRRPSSVFGPAALVMPLWQQLASAWSAPFDVRPEQPLLVLDGAQGLGIADSRHPARHGISAVRWAVSADVPALVPAAVAMFTEEVGYSPVAHDPRAYPRRVAEGVREARTVLATDSRGEVVFKTDLGLESGDACQLQGVWLAPAYRGRGLSAPLLAQACRLVRPRCPVISLYVNSYNARARALYRGLGFEQVDTFATVLF